MSLVSVPESDDEKTALLKGSWRGLKDAVPSDVESNVSAGVGSRAGSVREGRGRSRGTSVGNRSRFSLTVALSVVAIVALLVVGSVVTVMKMKSSRVPSFVHIPRTGGTAVEDLVFESAGAVGYCSFHRLGKMNYEAATDFYDGCPEWHTPPKAHVPDSFVVKRSPYTKLESEWGRNNPAVDATDCAHFSKYVTQTVKVMRDSKLFQCISKENFAPQALKRCRARFPGLTVNTGGCHFLPQFAFAQFVDVALPFEDFDGAVVRFLQAKVSPTITAPSEEQMRNSGTGGMSSYCWDKGLVTKEAWELVNEVYAVDFEKLGYDVVARPRLGRWGRARKRRGGGGGGGGGGRGAGVDAHGDFAQVSRRRLPSVREKD